MVFGSILGGFLIDCSCFFHCRFEAFLKMFFIRFLDRSLNFANPKIIDFSLVLIHYFAVGTSNRRSNFRLISDEFRDRFRIDFSSICMTFSVPNLASNFSLVFHEKRSPK